MPLSYTVQVELNLPREKVLELFEDREARPKWQRGFVSMTHKEGEPGQPGAKSDLVYQMGKRKIEMVETVTLRELPDRFDGTYDAKGVHNVVRNRFIEVGPDKTRWESDQEFHMKGMMKLFAWLMPGAFKKQSQKYMDDFKAFAEDGVDVRDEAKS